MASIYNLEPVYVAMGDTYGGFNYGFLTRSDITGTKVLGHTEDKDKTTVGIVYGANAPKPPRVRKEGEGRVFTTFCAPGQLKAAKAQGWQPSKPVKYRGAGGAYRKAYGVPLGLGSALYGQYLDADTGAIAVAQGGAELLDFDKGRRTIFGAQSHKPGKATLRDLKNKKSYSFFYDPAKKDDLATAGFKVTEPIGVYPAAPTP